MLSLALGLHIQGEFIISYNNYSGTSYFLTTRAPLDKIDLKICLLKHL